MKKTLLFLFAAMSLQLMAKNYDLDDTENLDLDGINRITIDMNFPNCFLCFDSINHMGTVIGASSGNRLEVSLEANINSNQNRAIPSIITEKSGSELIIRIYDKNIQLTGARRSGRVQLTVRIPSSYKNKLCTKTARGDFEVENLVVEEYEHNSSTGDFSGNSIQAETINIGSSSGDVTVDALVSVNEMEIHASSGDIRAGELIGNSVNLSASSGDIRFGNISAVELAYVKASSSDIEGTSINGENIELISSSGKINIDSATGTDIEIESSSGSIELNDIEAGSFRAKANSGDITVKEIQSKSCKLQVSSGAVRVTGDPGTIEYRGSSNRADFNLSRLNGSLDLENSSGGINISLPQESAFDIYIEKTSGNLRSDFEIIGNLSDDRQKPIDGKVNGGGDNIRIKVSSGDIHLSES